MINLFFNSKYIFFKSLSFFRSHWGYFLKAFLLVSFLIANTACSSLGVKPWEREILSKKEMIFGAYVLEAAYEDHTYFSKEGSSGGRSFSAGGCGCN